MENKTIEILNYLLNGGSPSVELNDSHEYVLSGKYKEAIQEAIKAIEENKRLKEEVDSTNQGLILQLKNGDILYKQLLELKEEVEKIEQAKDDIGIEHESATALHYYCIKVIKEKNEELKRLKESMLTEDDIEKAVGVITLFEYEGTTDDPDNGRPVTIEDCLPKCALNVISKAILAKQQEKEEK